MWKDASSKVILGVTVLALALANLVGWGAPAAQEADFSWSGERLRDAQPKPLPKARAPLAPVLGPLAIPPAGKGAPARAPTVDPGDALDQRLYRPQPHEEPGAEGDTELELAPQAAGSTGASFTQSRVFPARALRVFPHRAIGKLFATLPGQGDFFCSAFVVERRVIATAGHCVFDFVAGQGRRARDFVFIPGFDRGRAPFGSWTGTWARPAASWRAGDGSVPSVADFGVVTVDDRVINGRRVALGDVVGVLGWQLQVDVDQATLLGYPGNLDRGERMQQTDAAVAEAIPPNAIEFGSGQGGGASGGPIVEDFGQPASGQPQAANRVVSVVSFGTDGLWTLGGSVLNSEFADLIDRGCRRRAGNCAD